MAGQFPTQTRARSLAVMFNAASSVSSAAGVTRLADLTGLDEIGFPVIQAIRPRARSLSTAMGRGPTRRAAMVSALMEAIETDLVEKLRPSGEARTLASLGKAAVDLWCDHPRDPLAIRLDPAIQRHWIEGHTLNDDRTLLAPFDLVSHDLTLLARSDALRITVGLASGGSQADALTAALCELLEHDLEADWRRGSPSDRRATEINLASIDDGPVRQAVQRVLSAGCKPWLWSLGQDHDVACFLCAIVDGKEAATRLPPVAGAGCHPNSGIAALRALFEAAQARAAMISGARDDLTKEVYRDRELHQAKMQLASFSFGPGPLPWNTVPSRPDAEPERLLDHMKDVASRRTSLPLIVVPLASPHSMINVVKIVAPGLRICDRARLSNWQEPSHPKCVQRPRSERKLCFVGPTLWNVALPPGIERRAPAVAGDFAALLDNPPIAVSLIDGSFEGGPSVWHKEILDLLAVGVAVFGAASLGALRAAELEPFGMLGAGEIFNAYRDGTIVRDDAVMLMHAPSELNFRPLTVSLVDAEAALNVIVLPAKTRRMLQRIVRTVSFRDRTWPLVLDLYRQRMRHPVDLDLAIFEHARSVKQRDALMLLERMIRWHPPVETGARPPFTTHYRRLLETVAPMRP